MRDDDQTSIYEAYDRHLTRLQKISYLREDFGDGGNPFTAQGDDESDESDEYSEKINTIYKHNGKYGDWDNIIEYIGKFQNSKGEEYNMVLRYDFEEQFKVEDFDKISVKSLNGFFVPLQAIGRKGI